MLFQSTAVEISFCCSRVVFFVSFPTSFSSRQSFSLNLGRALF
jgi:hypothetical protein